MGSESVAIKAGVAENAEIAAAIASMTKLNRDALAIARRHGVTACTDVTGFGLCGHLRNLVRGSSLDARISLDDLPLLPGARAHAADGLVPGGSRANRTFLAPMIRTGTLDADRELMLSPQDVAAAVMEIVKSSARVCPVEVVLQPQRRPERSK